jgi:dihydrofolate reductase
MGNIRLDMSMSLDGFIVGPRDTTDEPMGIGGFRLFNWLDHREDPPHSEVYAELMAVGAHISGRRTYEHADHWQGDIHDGIPIFILTHDVPTEPPPGTVRFGTDARECAELARAAAGGADISVHGSGATRSLLGAGELDELELHVVPVLLGQGRRLFDGLPKDHVELELVRRISTPEVTHLRYRVRR